MHNVDWKVEIRRLSLLLLLAAFIGWIFSVTAWLLFFTTLLYIGWVLRQMQRIQTWLAQHSDSPPPESRGLWGDIFDGIYRIQRQNMEEKQRLQAAVDYLQDSFASLEDGTVMIDKQGAITWSNAAAEKLLGLQYPDDKSQQINHLIRAPEFIRYFDGGDYNTSLDMRSPNNRYYELQLSVSYFGQGSRLLFARDVTENNRLQQMRTDFVANVSHELRTPLTVINGYLETLVNNGLSDEVRCQRAISQMLGQSQRMETLIKDLIMLSRLESVPEVISQQVVNVRTLLEQIREEVLAAGHGQRQIIIDCDDSIQLEGNRDELHSAFVNLLMNAAKYTPEQGKIHLLWYQGPDAGCVAVEDNGDGIEAHHIPRLTERFYRVDDSRSSETGGTGLGLAIVKHILLRHQAELNISSSLGDGSSFLCEFPINRVIPRPVSD
ncbi:MAG: two-component system phosphate regulon sensor histidine kinase PhoR [Oceanicoccus sp.]|jgi:two-component system phosphate regulon sensor histidine kinase PhoR